ADQAVQPRPAPPDRALTGVPLTTQQGGPFYVKIGGPDSVVIDKRSLQIHLQRLVAAFVGSATSSSQFYTRAVTDARDATSSLSNDNRDEDRDGPAGFDSRGQRKREFAAEAALQAFTLAMAAEGVASAYADILGETWKPYERPSEPGAKLARKAGQMQMDAFS
ncbi:MAG: hypothetical protein AB7P20_10860, partial [Rhizobiaceae bacterium]